MHYDYTRFDWDDRTASMIYRGGVMPAAEKPHTVLIGAFLRWMHEHCDRRVTVSNHKRISVQARRCLECFEDSPDHFQHPEAPPASALRRALDYVEWFVCDSGAYFNDKKTLINCFSRTFYYWHAFQAPVNRAWEEHAKKSGAPPEPLPF